MTINSEMQQYVKKGKKTQHTAKPQQPVPTGQLPYRRNSKGQQQELQSPSTELVNEFLDRICAQTEAHQFKRPE